MSAAAVDPGLALLRALIAGATVAVELEEMTSTAWASATFIGARHTIRLTATDDGALAGWLAALPEAQFRLRGHLVVDVRVASLRRTGGHATIGLEALTIEEA